jgi:hypothetical protein
VTVNDVVTVTGEVVRHPGTGAVTVFAPSARASAGAVPPKVEIGGDEIVRTLRWLRTPGGMWIGMAYGATDQLVGIAVQEQPGDVLLALADDLLPE